MNYDITHKKDVYRNTFIRFEILKAMQKREVVILGQEKDFQCIRPVLILNDEFLEIFFNLNKFYKNTNNIFITLSKFKWVPPFKAENRTHIKEVWIETGYKFMYEYDLLLDFDIDKETDFDDMKKEVLNIARLLLKNKIKFMLYPSSKKGFHIIIPSEIFLQEKLFFPLKEQKGFNIYIGKLAKKFKDTFNLKFMDTNGVGAWNKIRKCEFSYNNNMICKPILNLEVINRNNVNDIYDCKKVISEFVSGYSPLKYFNEIMPIEDSQKYLTEFIKNYNLEVC